MNKLPTNLTLEETERLLYMENNPLHSFFISTISNASLNYSGVKEPYEEGYGDGYVAGYDDGRIE